jgi:hypothetical protein
MKFRLAHPPHPSSVDVVCRLPVLHDQSLKKTQKNAVYRTLSRVPQLVSAVAIGSCVSAPAAAPARSAPLTPIGARFAQAGHRTVAS